MPTAQEFLTEFFKEMLANPADRMTILAGYVSTMESREQAIKSRAKQEA